jgi:hypothetical protein
MMENNRERRIALVAAGAAAGIASGLTLIIICPSVYIALNKFCYQLLSNNAMRSYIE